MAVPAAIIDSLARVQNGFNCGLAPVLTEEGTSGSYALKEALAGEIARPVAFWKPFDEEPFAPNNPRGMQAPLGSETCRPGVKSGESSLREVLAYLLDHDGFAGVPPTALVEVSHPILKMSPLSDDQVKSQEFRNLISGLLSFKRQRKNSNRQLKSSPDSSPKSAFSYRSSPSTSDGDLPDPVVETYASKLGSFQVFVPNEGPIENFSPSLFPVDEIHKIAVLDLRILNLDRNACNILVQRDHASFRLVPIDHGLSIPDSLAVQSFDLAWLSFP